MKKIYSKFDKQLIPKLPQVLFKGKIETILSEAEAEKAVSYLLTQDIIGFEEFEDGKWFKGNLKYDHSEELDYGMKCANYTGVLYETK